MKIIESEQEVKQEIVQDHNVYNVMENSEDKEHPIADNADDIEITKKIMSEQDEQEVLNERIRANNLQNVTLTEADLHMFGDRTILAQVTQLLSYIRHAVKNNAKTNIVLTICNSEDTVANAEFMFDVNGCQVPDCVTQPNWWIN